ncbi:MAG: hypothetical protein E6R05_06565 [Candidatus Moraniibacteriota bacterium]|nr:MAG: hypothetical protein E6R05_06565 [Candidatus Moranbacteria bacterium]
MLSIAHAATGAVIANSISSPLSIPLIIASHYALDAIAHHDAGTGLSSGKKTRKTALILGIVDLILAAIVVLLMYPPESLAIKSLVSHLAHPAVWGAFLGLVPDFLESPRNFLKYEPAWLKPINTFHNSFHHSIPNIAAGLAPQVILLTILWIFR